jgi:hypothetical protein
MATANRRTETEDLTVERYDLELDDGEEQALLADPEGFVRNLLGDAHTINSLSIDTRIVRSQGCPGGYIVVHVVSGSQRSDYFLRCKFPE